MCFYTIYDYTCGDWKWGNMRLQCSRERRMGESCGHRLPHPETNVKMPHPCTVCKSIEIKQRRIRKVLSDIERWTRTSGLPSSVEKARNEAQELQREIAKLWNCRSVVSTWVDRTAAVYQLPPMERSSCSLSSRKSMDERIYTQ